MITIKNEDVISADLLSVEEVNEIPKWILANGEWWWLRSPGDASHYAAYVGVDGSVDDYGDYVHDNGYTVRPALIISNLPNLEIGETVKVFGVAAQYIGSDKVLLCESIFYRNFDEESNVYETSEVKKKMNKWFKGMKEKG